MAPDWFEYINCICQKITGRVFLIEELQFKVVTLELVDWIQSSHISIYCR